MAFMNEKQIRITEALNAINIAGGPTSLAKKLTSETGEDISPDRVSKWKYNGVAPHFVNSVAKITGISRTKLNPGLYPDEAA